MKKICLLLVVLASILTGCTTSAEDEVPTHVSIITGSYSNSYPVEYNSNQRINEALKNAAGSYGHVSFIRNDGSPEVLYSSRVEKDDNGYSKNRLNIIASEKASELVAILSSNANAVHPEIDTLSAIIESSEILENQQGHKLMIVVGSSLQTTGILNMVTNHQLLDEYSLDELVESLQQLHALPNLQGVAVVFLGIGDFTGDQTLSYSQEERLKELWRTICEAGGAKSVTFESLDKVIEVETTVTLPYVSIIPAKIEELSINESSEVIHNFTFDEVGFEPNTSILVNERAAQLALSDLANYLIQSQENVIIVGQTATGSREEAIRLSIERAEEIKVQLMNLGVPLNQMQTIGVGYFSSLHLDDTDENGYQIESIAYQNRRVIVITSESELAHELIELSDSLN